jgi:hypothetical protein
VERPRGVHEITLAADALAFLLTTQCTRTIHRAADGRTPEDNITDRTIANITQIRATETTAPAPSTGKMPNPPPLPPSDLSILMFWCRAVSEALETSPHQIDSVLDNARPGGAWRAEFNLLQPAGILGQALSTLANTVGTATTQATQPPAHDPTASVENAANQDALQAQLAAAAL